VLEKMRKAGTSLSLVAGAHLVIHVDKRLRRRVIFMNKDSQAVIQYMALIRNVDAGQILCGGWRNRYTDK
jgi:hypothetical protein